MQQTVTAAADVPASDADRGDFRAFVSAWVKTNCPPALIGSSVIYHGGSKEAVDQAVIEWCAACHAQGWTVPEWPKEYGGAGLDPERAEIVREVMAALGAPRPLNGIGVTMIGPLLLEAGTPEQKRRHLPQIAAGRI